MRWFGKDYNAVTRTDRTDTLPYNRNYHYVIQQTARKVCGIWMRSTRQKKVGQGLHLTGIEYQCQRCDQDRRRRAGIVISRHYIRDIGKPRKADIHMVYYL